MTFNSGEFLIFFPVVLLLYFLLPKKWSRISLLLMSYIFYIAWNYKLIVLILFTTAVSYFCARLIEKSEKKSVKKLCLAVTLVVCLGVLFFFKYYNFIASSLGWAIRALGGTAVDRTLSLVLPVGISFYTFQTLSYAIDVYRGTEKCEHDFLMYALFVSFFPQLVAGPIERPGNLMPQLRDKHPLTGENARQGLWMMAVGFFKKIAVADIIAGPVNAVFNSPDGATGLSVALSSMLFAVQIYCDFSGYTDIATGCARIMGIRLMKNFDRPYKSKSVKEFWARWHISLSTWLRDYLYFPLGGSRCSKSRHMFNLMVVFLCSGLWHGANWTFVLWGALHGVYRIAEELLSAPVSRLAEKLKINVSSPVISAVKRVFTFILICFAWIFFRANSLSDLSLLLSKLFSQTGGVKDTLSLMGLTLPAIVVIALSVIIMVELDTLYDRSYPTDVGAIAVRNTSVMWCVWGVAAAWLLLLSFGMKSSFIYFQF